MKKNKMIATVMAVTAVLCFLPVFGSCGASGDDSSTSEKSAVTNENENGNGVEENGNGVEENGNGVEENGSNIQDEEKENDDENVLPVPVDLSAEAAGSDSIDLIWNAVAGADIYKIAWGTSLNRMMMDSYSSTPYATIPNLDADTKYYFQVRAGKGDDEVIWSDWSSPVSARTEKENVSPTAPTVDNTVLSNVEKIDAFYQPGVSLSFTSDKKGIRLSVSWGKTTEEGRVAPNVVNFYRSTTYTNDFSAFEKIGTRAYKNTTAGSCFFEDFDVEFSSGKKYYYIAVATDSTGSAIGTWPVIGRSWICGDKSEVRYYFPSKQEWRWYYDGATNGTRYQFSRDSKSSGYEKIPAGVHLIEVSPDNESFDEISYTFCAGCKYKVDLSTKAVALEDVMSTVISAFSI